jgi:hypothetical protein
MDTTQTPTLTEKIAALTTIITQYEEHAIDLDDPEMQRNADTAYSVLAELEARA